MPKIAWLKKYQPDLYKKTDYFLLWADLVCFLLGGNPVTNYSLASRTLLFDFNTCSWADNFVQAMDLDISKLAVPVNTGVNIGQISKDSCTQLNLNENVAIISGGHDQCCAALGSGIIEENTAMYGMGTYICVVPAYSKLPEFESMFSNNLNIEHHVVPGLYVSFIYNISGGALVKWYRDTFACGIFNKGEEISYTKIFNEIPDKINEIIVIPRFGPTGPPDFFSKHAGSISGLSFRHTRGDILRAMLEGMTFYFKDALSRIDQQDIRIDKLVANGGGAMSVPWLQITSDILNKPIVKNKVSEAGALGAAIIAGVGSKVFGSYHEGIRKMVLADDIIYPDTDNVSIYLEKYESYIELYKTY